MDLNEARKRLPELRGLSDESAINVIHQVYYPAMDKGDLAKRLGYTPPKPEPQSRNAFAVANDLVIEGANAFVGGVGSIANMVRPGNVMSHWIDENIIKDGESKQSDVAKATKERFRADVESADGIGGELAAVGRYVVDAPALTMAQALGSFVTPGAAIKGAQGAARVARLGEAGVSRAGLAGGAAVGGAMAGGDAAGTAYELSSRAGATDEQALAAGRQASVIPAMVGAAGGLVGAERLFAGGKGFAGGAMSRALKTGAVEGGQEAFEEGVTTYEGQRAAMPYDQTIDPMKGVAAAAGMGAAMGGVTGAGVSLISPADQIRATKQPESGPMTRALNAQIEARAQEAEKAAPLALGFSPLAGVPTVFADGSVALSGEQEAQKRTTDAVQANLATAAKSQAPRLAGDVVSVLDEARARGLDFVPVAHPNGGGYMVVPRNWVTPDLVAPAVQEINATINRMRAADAQPVQRAERRRTDAADVAINADPVAGYVDQLRQVNTPAARFFVGEFDAGRVTRQDVEARMQAERGKTPDEILAEAAAQAPQPTDGLIFAPSGKPFATRVPANLSAKQNGGTVIEVPGGYAVRPKQEPTNAQAEPQPADLAIGQAVDSPAPAALEGQQGAAEPMGDIEQDLPAGQPEQIGALTGAGSVENAAELFGANEPAEAAQAPAVEAPEAARGNEPAAAGVSSEGSGYAVEADGVNTAKAANSAPTVEQLRAMPIETKEQAAAFADGYAKRLAVEAQYGNGHFFAAKSKPWTIRHADLVAKNIEANERAELNYWQMPYDEAIKKDRFRGLPKAKWDAEREKRGLSKNPQNLNASAEPVQKTAESEQVDGAKERYGINSTPFSQGGKPFKSKMAAAKAKKLQPTMRVVKVEGGYALADKTPAQLAAQAKAAKRLGGTGGEGPMSAHEFIAARGGLSPEAAREMGIERNQRIGAKWLVAGKGKGLTLERMTEALKESGYITEDSQNTAMELVSRSIREPQYTPEGWEQVAQAESEARFEDYLATEQEQPSEPDWDLTLDELDATGYNQADPQTQEEIRALMEQLDAMGVDAEAIIDDVIRKTENANQQDYENAAKAALQTALQASAGNRSQDTGRTGAEEGATEGQAEGLTSYTAQEVEARQDAADQAAQEAERADRAAAEADRQRQEREEVRRRSEAAADTFELGQDPMANLTGQRDIFSAPADPQQAQPQQPAAETPVEKTPAPRQKAARPADERIEDVGEQLYANRRNFTGRGLKWEDVEGLNDTLKIKEVTKAKVWPRPNYEQLVADGMPTILARMVKQVYDGISAGPTIRADAVTDEQLKRYIDTLAKIREGLFGFINDKQAVGQFASSVLALSNGSRSMAGPISIIDMMKSDVDAKAVSEVLLRRVWPEEYQGSARPFARGTQANGELAVVGGNKALTALQFVRQDFAKWAGDMGKGWPGKREAWEVQGYRVLAPGEYTAAGREQADGTTRMTIQAKEGRGSWQASFTAEQLADAPFVLVQDGGFGAKTFATREAAAEAAREKVKRKAGAGQDIRGTNIEAAERTGPARREEGEDINSQRLMDTFGFRGVNFGREGWINQTERQAYLNQAYDGLMDLADILGVPAKAMSLNGELGIAFGAQGKGKFAAHFVPGVNEINLTKTKGAGTLAHEWGHALDHHFAKQAGLAKEKEPFLSEHAYRPDTGNRMVFEGGRYVSKKDVPTFGDGIRPEIVRAFREVYQAMQKRDTSPAEAQANDEAMRASALKRLNGWIAAARREIEGSQAENKDDLLAEFDQHAEKLREGDTGDGYEKAGKQTYSVRVAAIRNLIKDATGRMWSADETKGLESNAGFVRSLMAKQDADRKHEPQKVSTQYKRDSAAMDAEKGGKAYWSTPAEMFARAFELYVHDKLAQKDALNTFLTDADQRASTPAKVADNSSAMARASGATRDLYLYPTGQERDTLRGVFDNLVGTIESRETDKGVVLFSRSPSTQAAYEARIDALFAGEKASRTGVTILDSSDVMGLLGFAKVPMVLNEPHIANDGRTNHPEMTAKVWKQIPEWIENPAAVYTDPNHPGKLTIVAPSRVAGYPVLIAVEPNSLRGKPDHLLVTAFAKTTGNLPPIGVLTASGRLLYADTKKAPEIWHGIGDNPRPTRFITGAKKILSEKSLADYRRESGSAMSRPMTADLSRAILTPTKAGVSLQAAKSVADGIKARWGNAPDVVVVESMQDEAVPQAVRDADSTQLSQGASGEPEGFWYKGKAYIVSGALRSENDVARVLFHEVLGHYGLRGTFGDELTPILLQLSGLRRKEVVAKARSYGLVRNGADGKPIVDVKTATDTEVFAVMSLDQRLKAAEEVLAEMAQNTPEIGFVKRAIAVIRQWLRRHVPGFREMALTDAEIIANFIMPARAFVERGPGGRGAGGVSFARVEDVMASEGDGAMFSRSSPIGMQARMMESTPDAVVERLTDLTTSQRGFNRWWHGTVGTQLHKAKTNKEFGRVYDAVQDFMRDTSRMAILAADQAPDLLPQVESLGDVKKLLPQMVNSKAREADLKATSDAMFDGTLRYGRDANGKPIKVDAPEDAGIVWTATELKAQGMSDAQIAMYQQARRAIDQSLDSLLAADVYRSATTVKPEYLSTNPAEVDQLLTDARKAAASESPSAAVALVRNALDAARKDRETELEKMRKLAKEQGGPDLDAAISDAKDELAALGRVIERLNDKVSRIAELKAKGYAPLMRFGPYTVDVLNDQGERVWFGMYENQYEANRAARSFREKGLKVSQGVQSQREFELLKGVSPETAMLFAEMLGIEGDAAMQEWLQKATAQHSALRRLIHRKGVEGFDDDGSRVVAAFITSNSRAAARALHGLRISEAVDNVKQGDVKDEAVALANYVQNPKEEAQAIRSLLFVNYIGGSVASALVNLTQTLVQTLPYLSQFGGPAKAAKQVGGAMRQAIGKVQDADTARALKRAEQDGIVKPQEIFQLQAEASRTLGSSLKVRAALAAWGLFFQLAETFNRRTAFIAAYELAKANKEADPFAFAAQAVEETQGVFNKGNRPNWGRGPVGATLFTFKTFTIQYVEFLKRLPSRERALALAVLVLLSGMRGLPFAEDAEDVLDTVAQGLGYNWVTRDQLNRFMSSTLGQPFADFLLQGASGTGIVPFDVSQRLGMGNMLPGTGLLKQSEARKEDEVLEVFGVAGGFVRDALKGEVRPVAIRNLAKGIEMYDRGIYTDSRGRTVMEADATDAAFKAIGLQPSNVARESRAIGAEYEKRTLFNKVKGDITEQIALGMFEKDQGKVKAARDKLAEWNEKNPEAQIVLNTQAIRRRVTEMQKDRAQRFVASTPKELRTQAREALQ
jgi:hypothetical protein